MDRIRQIIEEIKELEQDVTHRSALRIYTLLENNRKLFTARIDEDDFNLLLSAFEAISNKSPKEFATTGYKEEYRKNYQTLAFYLNRII